MQDLVVDNAERGLVHRRKSFKLLRRDAGELKRLLLGALCCFLPLLVLSHTAQQAVTVLWHAEKVVSEPLLFADNDPQSRSVLVLVFRCLEIRALPGACLVEKSCAVNFCLVHLRLVSVRSYGELRQQSCDFGVGSVAGVAVRKLLSGELLHLL